jgi:hypothetical protein
VKNRLRFRVPLFGALVALIGGCAAGMVPPDEAPDPAVAARMAEHTAPDRAYQAIFAWSLRERDARFNGRGSARVAPGYRARLDLFGPRDEAYLAAALIGSQLSLAAAADAAEMPPPELLWTVLGIFHPPERGALVRTSDDGSTVRLEYAIGDERWRYRFEGRHLVHVEWTAGRTRRRTVELRGHDEAGLPARANYRDWQEFVELDITLDQIHEVDSFPQDIWYVGR